MTLGSVRLIQEQRGGERRVGLSESKSRERNRFLCVVFLVSVRDMDGAEVGVACWITIDE